MIMAEIISMGCKRTAEDMCSTTCTEISSKFLESMSLSGRSDVGPMALSGNDRDNFSCFLESELLILL